MPDQDPVEIAELIAADLRGRAAAGTTVQVTILDAHAYPYATAENHPGLALSERVVTEMEGRAPLRVRMGATLPVCEIFRRRLGLDTILFSFSTSDEDYHAPNEFFRLSSWRDGLRAWAVLLSRAAEARS